MLTLRANIIMALAMWCMGKQLVDRMYFYGILIVILTLVFALLVLMKMIEVVGV